MRVAGRDAQAVQAYTSPHQSLTGDCHLSMLPSNCHLPLCDQICWDCLTPVGLPASHAAVLAQDFMNNVCTNILRLHQKKLIPYGGVSRALNCSFLH